MSQNHLKDNYTSVEKKVVKFKFVKNAKRYLFTFIGLGIISAITAGSIFLYFFILKDLPSPYALRDYKAVPLSSHISDRNGKLLYEVYKDENRTPVKLDQLPEYVPQAAIAIEDKDFYSHNGISIFSGILRAAKDTVQTNQLQGGSTITQQLIKSALLSPERTVRRKVKEILLATWAEQIYDKNEILEMYLNQVPYGGSSYGIEEAAKTYFGKSANKLTIDEAALLAGLPQAPSLYSPFYNPERAEVRRNAVLQRMYEQKFISEEERNKGLKAPIKVTPPKTDIKAPHFVFHTKKQLEEEYGTQQVEEGGLRVTTTLDLDIQQEAERILKEEIEELKNLNVTNGAILVMRPPTGEILAMVGSVDYFASPSGAFNVVTAPYRQPGSSIKPINYAIGIERGLVTAASIFLDTPTCFNAAGQSKPYCPKNYDGRFNGPVSLRSALANSYNIPAVKMLAYNKVDSFVASASAFTITSFKNSSDYGLSLTLGGGEVPMNEMAQAFSAFANRGKPKKIIPVLNIKDKVGKEIYEFDDPNFVQDVKKSIGSPNYLAMTGKEAISEETAFIISHILSDNGARASAFGTNSQLVIKDKTVSVKTGTTDDLRDNWTIGYTPNFLVAVWVGNNDFTPMNPYLVSGVTGAAPIWNKVMTYLLENQPNIAPIKPTNVIGMQVCNDTGAVASRNGSGYNCPTHFEYIIKGKEKASIINVSRQNITVNKEDKQAAPGSPDTEQKEKTVLRDQFGVYCVDCARDPEPTQKP